MKQSSDFDKQHPRRFRISTASLASDLSVVEVGYNIVPSGLSQIMQRDVYILHYITDGKGLFNGSHFDKSCGLLVVPGAREYMEALPDGDYEMYWIMFRGAGAKEILQLCGLPSYNSVFKFDKTRECADIIQNALDRAEPLNAYEETSIMTSAFYRILALHLQSKDNSDEISSDIAQKMRIYIDNCYHLSISVEEFAKKNSISRNYLYTLFKKEYGISPKEYLMNKRIEKAKQLLQDSSKNFSVSEAAFAVGFDDPLYFSRVFRKKTGYSPTKCKKDSI